jgi:uncharacterized protein (DUF4415 family)
MKGTFIMSPQNKTDLNKLNQMKDSEIDYSDIPETDADFWKEADVIYPANKTHLSIRLDDDIVHWFKKFGRGYQTKINAVLRSYISNIEKKQA